MLSSAIKRTFPIILAGMMIFGLLPLKGLADEIPEGSEPVQITETVSASSHHEEAAKDPAPAANAIPELTGHAQSSNAPEVIIPAAETGKDDEQAEEVKEVSVEVKETADEIKEVSEEVKETVEEIKEEVTEAEAGSEEPKAEEVFEEKKEDEVPAQEEIVEAESGDKAEEVPEEEKASDEDQKDDQEIEADENAGELSEMKEEAAPDAKEEVSAPEEKAEEAPAAEVMSEEEAPASVSSENAEEAAPEAVAKEEAIEAKEEEAKKAASAKSTFNEASYAGQSYYITRGGWFLNNGKHLRTSDPGSTKAWTFVETDDGYLLKQGNKYLSRSSETDEWVVVNSKDEAGRFSVSEGKDGNIRISQKNAPNANSYLGIGIDPKDHKFEYARAEEDATGGTDLLLFQDIDLTGDEYVLYTQGSDEKYYAITVEKTEDGMRCTAAEVEIVDGDVNLVKAAGDAELTSWKFDKQGAVKSNIYTTVAHDEGEETVYLFADGKTTTLSDSAHGFNISKRNEGDYGEGELYRFVGSQSHNAPVYSNGGFAANGTIDIRNAWFRLAKVASAMPEANDIPEDEGIEPADEIAEEIPEEIIEEIPEETVENIPEETVENIPEEIVENIPEETAEEIPEIVEEADPVPAAIISDEQPSEKIPAAAPKAPVKQNRNSKKAKAAARNSADPEDLIDIDDEYVPLAASSFFAAEPAIRKEAEAAPAVKLEIAKETASDEAAYEMQISANAIAQIRTFSGLNLVLVLMGILLAGGMAGYMLLSGSRSAIVPGLVALASLAAALFVLTEDVTGMIRWTGAPSLWLSLILLIEGVMSIRHIAKNRKA